MQLKYQCYSHWRCSLFLPATVWFQSIHISRLLSMSHLIKSCQSEWRAYIIFKIWFNKQEQTGSQEHAVWLSRQGPSSGNRVDYDGFAVLSTGWVPPCQSALVNFCCSWRTEDALFLNNWCLWTFSPAQTIYTVAVDLILFAWGENGSSAKLGFLSSQDTSLVVQQLSSSMLSNRFALM